MLLKQKNQHKVKEKEKKDYKWKGQSCVNMYDKSKLKLLLHQDNIQNYQLD